MSNNGVLTREARPSSKRWRVKLIHNANYTDVRYGKLHWRFTLLKAAIIKKLMEAAETPFPEVHHTELLEISGAFSEMRKLFRADPAWGELVVSMGLKRKGWYRRATEKELKVLHKRRFKQKSHG